MKSSGRGQRLCCDQLLVATCGPPVCRQSFSLKSLRKRGGAPPVLFSVSGSRGLCSGWSSGSSFHSFLDLCLCRQAAAVLLSASERSPALLGEETVPLAALSAGTATASHLASGCSLGQCEQEITCSVWVEAESSSAAKSELSATQICQHQLQAALLGRV